MPGLLENIGNKIEGLLGNPFVQGAVGAAVGGVSPLLGLLAGPAIKTDRERAKLKNDVLRSELTKRNRENQAQQELKALLSKQTTVQGPDRVAGLLDVEGGDPALFNLPSRRQSVPAIGTPQGQTEMIALLSQIAPQATATGLFGQIFPRRSTLGPKLDALQSRIGRQLTESEILNVSGAADPNASIETLIAQLQLQTLQHERDSEVKEQKVEKAEFANNLNSSADALLEMSEINTRLAEGGALTQPGLGAETRGNIASGAGAFVGLLGGDQLAENLSAGGGDTQRFSDLSNSLALDRLAVEGFNANTNARFNAFIATKPQLGRQKGPTDQRIADNLEALLLSDSARPGEGFSAERRKQIEALVKQLRGSSRQATETDRASESVQPTFKYNIETGELEPT